jgi:antitoxin component YwqK of YwqJK toxin-antitoxin module
MAGFNAGSTAALRLGIRKTIPFACIVFMVGTISVPAQSVDIFIPTSFNLEFLDESLNGDVASFRETELTLENEELPEKLFERLKNDPNGQLFTSDTVQSYYTANSQRKATFNNANQIAEIEDFDEDGKTCGKKVMKYNANGQLSERIEYDRNNKFDGTRKYEYNNDNQLIRESIYDEKNSLRDKNEIWYDSNGNVVQELDYDSENVLERRTLFLDYDANNNWHIKVTQSLDEDGTTRIMKRAVVYQGSVQNKSPDIQFIRPKTP